MHANVIMLLQRLRCHRPRRRAEELLLLCLRHLDLQCSGSRGDPCCKSCASRAGPRLWFLLVCCVTYSIPELLERSIFQKRHCWLGSATHASRRCTHGGKHAYILTSTTMGSPQFSTVLYYAMSSTLLHRLTCGYYLHPFHFGRWKDSR